VYERGTLTNASVVERVNQRYVPLKVDLDTPEGERLQEKYGVKAIPVTMFVTPDGDEVHSFRGAPSVEEFMSEVDHAIQKQAG
jgi:thiol:disulfide interchange protein